MLKWLWSWYGGSLGDNEETATINPNSMSPLPQNRFNNLARIKGEVDEDKEPYDNIYDFQRNIRLKNKRLKRIKEIVDEENIIDKNSNVNSWFFGKSSMR
jgi:hypothetical protein